MQPGFFISELAEMPPSIYGRLRELHNKHGTFIHIEPGVKISPEVVFPEFLHSLSLKQYVHIGQSVVFSFRNILIEAHTTIGDNTCFGKKQLAPFISDIRKSRMDEFDTLVIGIGSQFAGDSEIHARELKFGNFSKLATGVRIDGYKYLVAGHNLWVGRNSTLNATGGLRIGNNTGIGEHCRIWSHGCWSDLLEGSKIYNVEEVVIGDECWVAAGVTINPGVIVANRVMMLPETNVTKPILEENIVVGQNPAKKIQIKRGDNYQDLIHFGSKTKEERYNYLQGVLDDFSQRFEKFHKETSPHHIIWEVSRGDYSGVILLLLKNIDNSILHSYFNGKREAIIFSPEQLVGSEFTCFDYMRREHSSLLKPGGDYNLLALEFIRSSNTFIAKFIPVENPQENT